MDRGWALLATLAVGALVAFQPPANEQLGRLVGDLGAAFTSLVISTVIIGVLLVTIGSPTELGNITGIRPEHFLGGIAGAAIVFVSLVTVRQLGVAGVAAALVVAQLIAAAVIDRLALLGVEQVGFTLARLAGVVLLIAGTLLVTSR